MAHTQSVGDEKKSPYAVSLSELERATRVPLDDQVTQQEMVRPVDSDSRWDEEHRQLHLAGGA